MKGKKKLSFILIAVLLVNLFSGMAFAVETEEILERGAGSVVEQKIPKDALTASANSVHTGKPASNVLEDGDSSSFWDAAWQEGDIGLDVVPIILTITLDRPREIKRLTYSPRQDDGVNGTITQYKVTAVKEDDSEELALTGTWAMNKQTKTASFAAITAKAIKLEVVNAQGGKKMASGSKVDLYELVSFVELDKNLLTLKTEESHPLSVVGDNGGEEFSWSSNHPEIASVDSSGLVTGIAEGTATITATAADNRTAVCEVSISNAEVPKKPGYVLAFSDDFDGTVLDDTKWNNWCVDLTEPEYFRYENTPDSVVAPENVKVEDGSLRLMGTKDPVSFNGSTSNYKMGTVQTRDKFQPTYGYMEAMVQFPDVAGSNPAVWTMPRRTEDNTDWQWDSPEGKGAEIDVLERPHPEGSSNYADLVNKYWTTIHFDNYNGALKYTAKPAINDPYKWHKFGIDWTKDYVKFLLDDKVVGTYSGPNVPTAPEIFILSYGLGGWLGTIDPKMEYSEMLVDYVRWYQVDPVKAKMSRDVLTINTDETKTLTVSIEEDGNPSDVVDPIVLWESSNTDLVTVDQNGQVKGIAEGTAVITATTKEERTAVCEVSISEAGKIKPGYKLVFEDNFSGEELDSSKWNNWCVDLTEPAPFRYGNSKEVALVPENAYVKDGSLRLLGSKGETIFEGEAPSEYRMGAVQTRDIFEPTYGYMETMVKIPDVPGSNPAIWTMPQASKEGGWQWDSDDESGKFAAEIDILERPHPKGDGQYAGLVEKYWVTMHYDNYNFTKHPKYHAQPTLKNPYQWHKFGMEWAPEYINFFLDGKLVASQTKDVPNAPEIFILSYGLGGWIGKIADEALPAEMLVDYVRWYQTDNTSVAIKPASLALGAGESKQLEAEITPQTSTDKVEMWISSNPSIASVNDEGMVAAKANGQTKVRIITEEGRTASCNVTVSGYPDTPTPTQNPGGGSGGGGSSSATPAPTKAPTETNSTVKTENGGSLDTTTKTIVDTDGNKTIEAVTVEKNKENTVVGKTVAVTVENKKEGSSVKTEVKQDAAGKELEASATVTQTKANTTVNGSTAQINILVQSELVSKALGNTKLPVDLTIEAAQNVLSEQIRNPAVKDATLKITIPDAITANPKVKIKNIILNKEAVTTAKNSEKNIAVEIKDGKGKLGYSWSFEASRLKDAGRKIEDVNLALDIVSSKNNVVLSFNQNGLLPATAKVKVGLLEESGFIEGSTAYVYYSNKKLGKLDKLPKEKYNVGKGGYLELDITHCSDYIVSPAPVKGTRTLLQQIVIPSKQSVKIGKSKLTVNLPDTLKMVIKYSQSEDPGVKEAKTSYKSSNPLIASVSASGQIQGKKAGTAKITTSIILKDGTKKDFVTTVTVKKA